MSADDADTLRWLPGLTLPPKGTHYRGSVFPLGSNIDTIKRCLREQIDEGYHQPSIDGEHFTGTGLTHGLITRARVLSKAEAEALGIPQKCEHEVYFGAEFVDSIREAYDRGEVNYGSPELRGTLVDQPYTDETGREWEFFVGGMAIVSGPHNVTQTPAVKVHGVKMSATGGSMTPEELEALKAEQAAQRILIEAIAKKMGIGTDGTDTGEADEDDVDMAGCEDGKTMGADAGAADAGAAEDKADVAMSAAKYRKIAAEEAAKAIKMANQQTLAERDVDAVLAEREIPDSLTRAELLKVRMSAPKAFVLMSAALPAKAGGATLGGFRERAAVGGPAKPASAQGRVIMGSAEHAKLHHDRAVAMAKAAGTPDRVNAFKVPAKIEVDQELRAAGRL